MSTHPPHRPNPDLPPIEMYHQRKRVGPMTAKIRFDAARMAGERFIITRPTRPSEAFWEGVFAGMVALLAGGLIAFLSVWATGASGMSMRALMGFTPFVGIAWFIYLSIVLGAGSLGELWSGRPMGGAVTIAVIGVVLMFAGLNPAELANKVPLGPSTAFNAFAVANFPSVWAVVAFALAAGFAGARTKHRWLLVVAFVVAIAAARNISHERVGFAEGLAPGFPEAKSVFRGIPALPKALQIRMIGDILLLTVAPLTLFRRPS